MCDDVILDLLCGEHNQLKDWLDKIESLGSNPDLCATLKSSIESEVRQRKLCLTGLRVLYEGHCNAVAHTPMQM